MLLDPTKLAQIQATTEFLARELEKLYKALAEIVDGTEKVAEIAESFVVVKGSAETLHEAIKNLNKLKEHISYTKLPEAFFEEEIKTLTTESGYRITISSRMSVTFQQVEVDRDWLADQPWAEEFVTRISNQPDLRVTGKMAGYEWLKAHDMGALIQETVNASSLSSAIKELIEEEGKDPPDQIFSVKPAPFASVTKVKR